MNQPLPSYPEYKPTGQPWLKQVPAHWEVKKVKRLFRERSEKGYPDEPLLASTQKQGVVLKTMVGSRTVEASKDFHLLKLVRVGDFVISLRSFEGGIEYAHYQGIISPAYNILTPNNLDNAAYFSYLLKSRTFIDSLTLFVTGIREGQNIDYAKFNISFLPVPPLLEQRKIVKFLDSKARQIAKLLRTKRQLTKLLQEQKQNLIQNTLLKGLNKNAPLKNSGVAWLGSIPAHWQVKRTKYFYKEVDARSVTGQETHLSMSQKFGLVPNSTLDIRRMLSESYIGGKLCKKDDLVLNRLKAHLGVFALATEPGLISPDYTVLRATGLMCHKYFESVLKTPACRVELRSRTKGIVEGFWRLYTDDFYDIKLPIPPIDEQEVIMQHLNEETRLIDETIDRAQREIELIQEYRTRLMADVVTGRIDVRHLTIDATAPVLEEDDLLDEEEVDEDELIEETLETDD